MTARVAGRLALSAPAGACNAPCVCDAPLWRGRDIRISQACFLLVKQATGKGNKVLLNVLLAPFFRHCSDYACLFKKDFSKS